MSDMRIDGDDEVEFDVAGGVIRVRRDEGMVRIYAISKTSAPDAIQIIPRVSNVVHIGIDQSPAQTVRRR